MLQKDKEVLHNMTSPLQDTPCEAGFTQRFCNYPLDVAQHFPDDKEFKRLGIEKNPGSLLQSKGNAPIGIIALMEVKPSENAAFSGHLILVSNPAIEEVLFCHGS